jgi:deoxyribonuclease-1-like protein
MSDQERGGGPLQVLLMMGLIAGGGYAFFKNYEIDGLDQLSLQNRPQAARTADVDEFTQQRSFVSVVANSDLARLVQGEDGVREDPFAEIASATPPVVSATQSVISATQSVITGQQVHFSKSNDSRTVSVAKQRIGHGTFRNLKVGSWALDGFGPTKLANRDVRAYVAKIGRRFDVLAIQQVSSIERDLVPRLVDELNLGENRFDYLIGDPTGPRDRGEQMAFIFDTSSVEVDRSQTYTVDDPDNRFTFDPLVAWFRACEPESSLAWTFSMVNVRIDLPRASDEVALLPSLMEAVAQDGRGEDDVILGGLMQADDAYLIPTFGVQTRVAVRHRSTDIFDRYQTANIILDGSKTSEYLGRGGVFDFARHYQLGRTEAEAITSHLPVYGEFTAHEGGDL